MSLPVEESDFVYCDVQDITRYLRQRNPAAAARFSQAFKTTVSQLSQMPYLGRRRPDLGAPETRSWRISGFRNYLIFYETQSDKLRILRVLHGYRDLQSELNR